MSNYTIVRYAELAHLFNCIYEDDDILLQDFFDTSGEYLGYITPLNIERALYESWEHADDSEHVRNVIYKYLE